MVEQIKAIAVDTGATCYADPFIAAPYDMPAKKRLVRAKGWLTIPATLPLWQAGGDEATKPPYPVEPSLRVKDEKRIRQLGW
jgi:hypothetical protein